LSADPQKRQFKQTGGRILRLEQSGGNGTIAEPAHGRRPGLTYAIGPSLVLSATLGFGRWSEGRKPPGRARFRFPRSGAGALDTLEARGIPAVGVTGIQSLVSGVLNSNAPEKHARIPRT